MEEKVFRRPAVAGKLESGFVEARLHSDHSDPAKSEFAKSLAKRLLNNLANPIYVTIHPDTGVLLLVQYGATSEAKFLDYLDRSLASRDKVGPDVIRTAGAPAPEPTGELK